MTQFPFGPYVSLGKRLSAYLVDVIVFLGLLAGVAAGLVAAGYASPETSVGGFVLVLAEVIALPILLGFLYFYVPVAMTGYTLGKRLCGIQVVRADDDSKAPGWGRTALRVGSAALLCIIPLGFIVDAIALLADRPKRRSLHDHAARTVVVRTDWTPAEGYQGPTKPGGVLLSVGLLALLVAGSIVAAVALAGALMQSVKDELADAADQQLRMAAVRVGEMVHAELAANPESVTFPIEIAPGAEGAIGTQTYANVGHNSVLVSAVPDVAGAFCVRVTDTEHLSSDGPEFPPVFFNSVTGATETEPCDEPASSGQ